MKVFFHSLPVYFRQILAGAKSIKRLNLSILRKVFSLMGKKEKIALVALGLLGAVGFLWSVKNLYYAITVPAPAFGDSFTEGFLGQPNYINPVLAFSENDLALVRLVYSGLYKYDGQGNLVSDLAEGFPQISEDQKQYTVALKKNVQWHNGRKFKADDVVFTILTIKDKNFNSPLRPAWASTNVEKLDDYTVKFTTKEVSGPFVNNLTLPILPMNLWGKAAAQTFALSENNLKAVGTGPFALKEIKKLASGKIQAISLQSFSNYYAGKPRVDNITIKFYDQPEDLINALHSREIQGFGYLPFNENLYLDPQREDVRLIKLPLPQYQVVFFNYLNKNLKENHVRASIAKLISREEILASAWGNSAASEASSLFDFYSPSPNPQTEQTDPQAAKNLLEAAGWKKNAGNGVWEKNGQALALRLFTNDFLPNARAAEKLAQTFRAFGIEIILNILPSKQLSDNHIKPRDFDILLFTQKFGSDPDPFAFWHSSQIKDPGLNLSGFEDPEADKLLTAARTTTDKALRQAKYEQLRGLLTDRIPVVFLTQTVYTYALDKNIKGASLTKLYDTWSRFYDVPNWYVMETRVFK